VFVGPGLGNPNPKLRGSDPNWNYQVSLSHNTTHTVSHTVTLFSSLYRVRRRRVKTRRREPWTEQWKCEQLMRDTSTHNTSWRAIPIPTVFFLCSFSSSSSFLIQAPITQSSSFLIQAQPLNSSVSSSSSSFFQVRVSYTSFLFTSFGVCFSIWHHFGFYIVVALVMTVLCYQTIRKDLNLMENSKRRFCPFVGLSSW